MLLKLKIKQELEQCKEMSSSVFGLTRRIERKEVWENEPALVSRRRVRSDRLLGFEVSLPCTFQSQCLFFKTNSNILKCIFKEHFIAYSTLFIFYVRSNVFFIACCLLRHFTILLRWNVNIMRIMEDIFPRQFIFDAASRQLNCKIICMSTLLSPCIHSRKRE